jgi:hypothetical protein
MSTLRALAKAEAAVTGFAQPIATVRHVHLCDRPFVLVALALAGEANAPLAAMVGDTPESARLLVVAQPRNRDQRFAFAAELARIVVGYIGDCESALRSAQPADAARSGDDSEPGAYLQKVPQFIVPNQATVGFLRLLGRSTRLRRPEGEYPVDPAVPVLGRWLTWLAERAEVPGSCVLLAATQSLALHWASGQSDVEDQNLATLLGWIDPPAGLTGQGAAAAAEDPLTCPPAGPATDPTFDNEVLAPLIAACSRPEMDSAQRQAAILSLQKALAGQLAPAWRSVWQAVGLLRELAPGDRVRGRWEQDQAAFAQYAEHVRDGGPPQPRRDSAVAAARRLNRLEREQASYAAQRAFDDPLVLAEYRLTGEAFGGAVTAAEPDRVDSSGRRRKLRPLVTVETEDLVRIGIGAVVVSPARPSQKGTVLSVTELAGARSAVLLELAGGMGHSLVPTVGSVPAVGERLVYTTLTDAYQLAGTFPDREHTPWTHGGPPPVYVPASEDVTEAWS